MTAATLFCFAISQREVDSLTNAAWHYNHAFENADKSLVAMEGGGYAILDTTDGVAGVRLPHGHQLVPPRRGAGGELLPLHVPRPRAKPLGVTAPCGGGATHREANTPSGETLPLP